MNPRTRISIGINLASVRPAMSAIVDGYDEIGFGNLYRSLQFILLSFNLTSPGRSRVFELTQSARRAP